MADNHKQTCAYCGPRACRKNQTDRYPSFCPTIHADEKLRQEALSAYKNDSETAKLTRVAAEIEADFYGKYTRVQETVAFIQRMGFTKVGIATCLGLLDETRIFSNILESEGIEHYVAGCKLGAVDKTFTGLPDEKKLYNKGGHESMCNPIMQAKALAAWGAEFCVLIGLCIGHDSLFIKYATTPVTVMIVKDRVLAHNTVAALYTANGNFSRFPALRKKK